jgi:tRNA G18 (ribose-2'-O)-methylase SpoU
MKFAHVRHRPPEVLDRPREIVVVLAPMRSNVNLSRVVRAAGCFGIQRVIACGQAKLEAKIARDGADQVQLEVHRSLPPLLPKLKSQGFQLVGLEQTTNSTRLADFPFVRATALIVGNEREGLEDEVLSQLDAVVEIPGYGLPFSHNAATAATIAMYEYCRQFPLG